MGHRNMADETLLKQWVESHHRWTGSLRAREILDHWAESRARFVKVMPTEYKRALGEIKARAAAQSALSKAQVGETSTRPALTSK
jgi:glutamate synthase (NADPH/NADH) large chain